MRQMLKKSQSRRLPVPSGRCPRCGSRSVKEGMVLESWLVTVIVAGVGLVLSVICRLVPILLAAAFVVGVLWLIGRIARALGRK